MNLQIMVIHRLAEVSRRFSGNSLQLKKIPMTSPSLVIRQLYKLGGKRLQKTCASQLGDDGWEKDGAFLFFFCSSHRVACNVSEIS